MCGGAPADCLPLRTTRRYFRGSGRAAPAGHPRHRRAGTGRTFCSAPRQRGSRHRLWCCRLPLPASEPAGLLVSPPARAERQRRASPRGAGAAPAAVAARSRAAGRGRRRHPGPRTAPRPCRSWRWRSCRLWPPSTASRTPARCWRSQVKEAAALLCPEPRVAPLGRVSPRCPRGTQLGRSSSRCPARAARRSGAAAGALPGGSAAVIAGC